MQAQNAKSLFATLCKNIEDVRNGDLSVELNNSINSSIKQINILFSNELKRAQILMQMSEHNANQNYKKIELREIESKSFDNTI